VNIKSNYIQILVFPSLGQISDNLKKKILFCLTISEVSISHGLEGMSDQSSSQHGSQLHYLGQKAEREDACKLRVLHHPLQSIQPLVYGMVWLGLPEYGWLFLPWLIFPGNILTDTSRGVCYYLLGASYPIKLTVKIYHHNRELWKAGATEGLPLVVRRKLDSHS
jgi:hypothetical protein